MTEHPGEPYTLALLDIDDFKVTNDLYGHSAGDAALKSLARVMESSFPTDAILGRNGGDEMLIMLTGDNTLHADELFDRLVKADLSFEHDGQSFPLTISVGYACFPEDADSLSAAYTKADAALYAVKLGGKSGAMRHSAVLSSQYRSQLGFTPRDIAEHVPGAMLVHKAGGDGEIMFANDELIEMLECDSLNEFMEYTGGTFRGMVHPDDRAHVYEEALRQVDLADIGARNFIDYRIITKKGTVRNVADNGRLIDIKGIGKVFYVLIVDQDERAHKMAAGN